MPLCLEGLQPPRFFSPSFPASFRLLICSRAVIMGVALSGRWFKLHRMGMRSPARLSARVPLFSFRRPLPIWIVGRGYLNVPSYPCIPSSLPRVASLFSNRYPMISLVHSFQIPLISKASKKVIVFFLYFVPSSSVISEIQVMVLSMLPLPSRPPISRPFSSSVSFSIIKTRESRRGPSVFCSFC